MIGLVGGRLLVGSMGPGSLPPLNPALFFIALYDTIHILT